MFLMSNEDVILTEQEEFNEVIPEVPQAPEADGAGMSRRHFLFTTGAVGAGALLLGQGVMSFLFPNKVVAYPTANGALLVDTKKCANCMSCMLACSSVHNGAASLTKSRIQIDFDPFAPYPQGARQVACHQCDDPKCVAACPTGANHVDTENGNVRTVDARKCMGCQQCIEACPFLTSRVQWDGDNQNSQKCDLCVTSEYWNEEGGPGGKQACMSVCPMHAISYTEKSPEDGVYEVNLREDAMWAKGLGFPAGDSGQFTPEQIIKKDYLGNHYYN
jgi:protein NrfC